MNTDDDRKASFFISYCMDDVPAEFLEYLIWLLQRSSPEDMQPLVFSRLRLGADVEQFMRLLNTEASVLLLLGPGYCQRIRDRKGGVYTEWSIIVDRLQRSQADRMRGRDPSTSPHYLEVFPLLYCGDESSAIPPEISHLRWKDIRNLRVQKSASRRFTVTATSRKQYFPVLRELGENVRHAWSVKRGDALRASEDLFKLFFVDLKSGWNQLTRDQQHYLDSVFVRTFAYRKLDSQSAIFLVGRKGSGKSTLTDIMGIRNAGRYKGIIGISGDDLNLEAAFALYDPGRVRSDLQTLFGRTQAFRFAWEVFLRICCIEALVLLDGTGHLTKHQTSHIPHLRNWLRELAPGSTLTAPEPRNTYFTYAFSALTAFLERCIREARGDAMHFLSDVQGAFTRAKYRDYAIPPTVQSAATAVLEPCRRHFLISLDGFNTAYDKFRRSSESRRSRPETEQRAQFEVEWLSAFLAEILDAHLNPTRDPLYRLMEFCITVPQDRFFEVMAEERDSYRYASRFRWLNWSGIELAILLRKRLEEYSGYRTKKYSDSPARLENRPELRLARVYRAFHGRH